MKNWFYIVAAFDTKMQNAGGLQFFHFRIEATNEFRAYDVGMINHWNTVKDKLSKLDGDFILNDYVIEIKEAKT